MEEEYGQGVRAVYWIQPRPQLVLLGGFEPQSILVKVATDLCGLGWMNQRDPRMLASGRKERHALSFPQKGQDLPDSFVWRYALILRDAVCTFQAAFKQHPTGSMPPLNSSCAEASILCGAGCSFESSFPAAVRITDAAPRQRCCGVLLLCRGSHLQRRTLYHSGLESSMLRGAGISFARGPLVFVVGGDNKLLVNQYPYHTGSFIFMQQLLHRGINPVGCNVS